MADDYAPTVEHIEALEAENKRLLAENKRLREEGIMAGRYCRAEYCPYIASTPSVKEEA